MRHISSLMALTKRESDREGAFDFMGEDDGGHLTGSK